MSVLKNRLDKYKNQFLKELIGWLGESIIEYFSSKVVKLRHVPSWVNIQGQTTYRSLIRNIGYYILHHSTKDFVLEIWDNDIKINTKISLASLTQVP